MDIRNRKGLIPSLDYLILLLAFVPLILGIWQKSFWNDELYTIFYSLHQKEALGAEPHSPLSFSYIWSLYQVFGLTPWLNLASVVPSYLSLIMLYFIGKRCRGRWFGFCLILVLVLNPIFLHFARSLRGNAFLYIMPIALWWILDFIEGERKRYLMFFIASFFGGMFLYVNIPVSFLVLALYFKVNSKKKSKLNIRKLLIVNSLAVLLCFLVIAIKYFGFMQNWPYSYYLDPNLETLHRWLQSYFFFAEESFSIVWEKDQAISSYRIFHNILFAILILLSLIFTFIKDRNVYKIQLVFIFSSFIYTLTIWLFSIWNFPVLLPRSHLLIFGLIQISLGMGFGIVRSKVGRGLVVICFVLFSCYHLNRINFFTMYPKEIEAIKFSKAQGGILLVCGYYEKFTLIIGNEFERGCSTENLNRVATMSDKIVLPHEFFDPKGKNAIEVLKKMNFSYEVYVFHYSQVYIFLKK